jgi:hypothetical protein
MIKPGVLFSAHFLVALPASKSYEAKQQGPLAAIL